MEQITNQWNNQNIEGREETHSHMRPVDWLIMALLAVVMAVIVLSLPPEQQSPRLVTATKYVCLPTPAPSSVYAPHTAMPMVTPMWMRP